jgi:hypothetical protein
MAKDVSQEQQAKILSAVKGEGMAIPDATKAFFVAVLEVSSKSKEKENPLSRYPIRIKTQSMPVPVSTGLKLHRITGENCTLGAPTCRRWS